MRWLHALDVTLEVAGRAIAFPLVLTQYHGDRYLVAMLGDRTNWVRNIHAAQGHAVLRHDLLEEVAPGARAHFPVARDAPLAEFERIAPQYPVFRVAHAPRLTTTGGMP